MSFDMSAATVGFAREALLSGDAAAAVGSLRSLPSRGQEANYWLASALMAQGEHAAAAEALDAARKAHALELAAVMQADVPKLMTDADYAATVASQLYRANHVAAASVVFGLAVAGGHASQAGLLTYGLALQHQGRAEEAITVFRAAIRAYPSAGAHQFLLYPHFMVDNGPARYAAEARAWAELYAPSHGGDVALTRRPLAGRKLRIGYVSPSFARTQIHQFIAPILEAHDRTAVEVFLYPAAAEGEEGWPAPTTVRPIGQLADADAVALIRADEIDVLVDCWGHSAGSRLPLFAQRCAPMQVAWINFVQTTGLPQMDYVLHADSMAAPGTEALFTETVWPIGPICIPYRPAADRPAPSPTPALRTGQITFGSFNHPVKLSNDSVRAWARILKGRAGSKLVLKYSYYADPVLRRITQARFAGEGVAPERIEFRGWSTGADYLRAFADIDLALDPSPTPGGTTTCDALANGVPVLTLRGSDFYSRIGVHCLVPAGLAAFVADDWDDYVDIALRQTADIRALDAVRSTVRPGFDGSAHRDEAGFTRHLEGVMRQMAERARGDRAAA